MKSFKQLMEDIREAKQVTPEKSSSSEGNPHGTAYEILVAAHMRRHISGHPDLRPEHFPHSVREHLDNVPQGQHKESEELLNKLVDKAKRTQIDAHARADAETMVSHMENNDNERYKTLVKKEKGKPVSVEGRFVHVPDVKQVRDVVHKHLPKDQDRPSVDSNADIIFTNGRTHIGADTKYGRVGGITDAGKTHDALLGLLRAGHTKKSFILAKTIAARLKKIEKTPQNKNLRSKMMRRLAKLHARAFNRLPHEERRKRMSQMMNAGSDENIRTFRLHRDPTKEEGVSITEPSEKFSDNVEGTRFIARSSGQGFHVYRRRPGEGLTQYQRIGISSKGRGKTEEIRRTPRAVSRKSSKEPSNLKRIRKIINRGIDARKIT